MQCGIGYPYVTRTVELGRIPGEVPTQRLLVKIKRCRTPIYIPACRASSLQQRRSYKMALAIWKWEKIGTYNVALLQPAEIFRAKVPGGWLINVREMQKGQMGLTFFPDPNHQWDGKVLP